jgi:hypothetical protein
MNVASLELCRELFKLSRWDDTYWFWKNEDNQGWVKTDSRNPDWLDYRFYFPAYDLGYLLRIRTLAHPK